MITIDGIEVAQGDFYLSPVTYIPTHAKGNAGHEDCERGVLVRVSDYHAFVLYCKSRTVQTTAPEDLVWG